MAISLPDARQLSDEVLQSLRLRALRGCELGYSEIEVAELLGLSRETVSRWSTAFLRRSSPGEFSQADCTRPPGRPRSFVLNFSGQAAPAADDPQRKKPRGGGDRLPVVDPPGRRRVDPQGVRDRHAGADRRRVPRAVGLHFRFHPVMPRIRTPRRSAVGWRSPIRRSKRGPPVRMRRSTGATRPARRPTSNRDGVTPARGGRRGSRCPIPTSA